MVEESNPQKRLGAALFYGVVLVLAYLVYRVFEPFLAPLAWAAVLVVVFYPWHAKLERRMGRTTSAVVSTAGVTLILIIPTLLVMGASVREGVVAARSAQGALTSGRLEWVNHVWEWLGQRLPGTTPQDMATLARQGAERAAGFIAAELGAVLRNVAAFFFDLAIVILAMFYMFRDKESILAGVRGVLPFAEEHREKMLSDVQELIFASVTSSLVAALALGLTGGVAFAIAGIGASLFWGVMMAFFSFVPLVGSALIWAPAGIGLIVEGYVGRGVFVLVFCTAGVSFVDNVARPWLISGRARLSGLVLFISILGGLAVFGLLGLVLGPIVVAMASSVLALYTNRESVRSGPAAPPAVGRKPTTVLE